MGEPRSPFPAGLTCISYNSLTAVRTTLQDKMQKAFRPAWDRRRFRTMLAKLRPDELGPGTADDRVLSRFQVSLLTEGSGNAGLQHHLRAVGGARSVAPRPTADLIAALRAAPARASHERIARGDARKAGTGPAGSLVDADMGAYYTWLNQQRLEGAGQSSFLVWFEDHNEAIAIGPTLPRATESSGPVELEHLVRQVAA